MNDKAETEVIYPDITIKIGEKVISGKEAIETILIWAREHLVQFFSDCKSDVELIKSSAVKLDLNSPGGKKDVSHAHMRKIGDLLRDYFGNETTDKK